MFVGRDVTQSVTRSPHSPQTRCIRSAVLPSHHQPGGRCLHAGQGPEKIINGGIPSRLAIGPATAMAPSIAGTKLIHIRRSKVRLAPACPRSHASVHATTHDRHIVSERCDSLMGRLCRRCSSHAWQSADCSRGEHASGTERAADGSRFRALRRVPFPPCRRLACTYAKASGDHPRAGTRRRVPAEQGQI